MRLVLIVVLGLYSAICSGQKPYPSPPDKLSYASYFDPNDAFVAEQKAEGMHDEGFELYVDKDADQFRQLLDSVQAGWTAPKLRHIILKWNIDPEETDESKFAVIKKVVDQLPRLKMLIEKSGLQSMTLSVGDGLFMTEGDGKEYFDSKKVKANVLRASETVRKVLEQSSIKLTVYAENWGW